MRILSIDSNKDYIGALLEAVKILQTGGVVVYPTDTIYCLGANICDKHAAELVFKIKNRPLARPLPVIARNIKWVKELAFVPPKLEKVLGEIWPGSTAVILPKKKIIPQIVTSGENTVSIRIPDYVLTDKLLGKLGYPLTATSANITGEELTSDINKIVESYRNNIWKPDLILDVGPLPLFSPPAILDLSTIKPKILRVGPSNPEQLLGILNIKNQNAK